MIDLLAAIGIMLVVVGSATYGFTLQRRLPLAHRTKETVVAIQLITSMFVTFAALVLSLLIYSAQGSYDLANNNLRLYAAQLVQFNRSLREYGPDADNARHLLRRYTEAAIASTWPDEAPPPGHDYPRHVVQQPHSIESVLLGRMLHQIETDIRHFMPSDAFHRRLASDCLDQYLSLVHTRWRLIEGSNNSASAPFLLVLVFWLAVLFLSFGLTAPHNKLVYILILLCALAVTAAIYVILEMSTPLSGFITLPSDSMRSALAHMRP